MPVRNSSSTLFTVRLPNDLLDELNGHVPVGRRTEFVRDAVVAALRRAGGNAYQQGYRAGATDALGLQIKREHRQRWCSQRTRDLVQSGTPLLEAESQAFREWTVKVFDENRARQSE